VAFDSTHPEVHAMTRAATPTEPLTSPASPATNGTAPPAPARRTPRPNRVELTGRVKATPSLRHTTNGNVPVAELVLVTNEQTPQDVRVVAWRELQHNDPLTVVGRVVVRTYTTDEGDRSYLEIAAVHLLPADRQTAQPEMAAA
jgi:hypothetical protein